MIKTLKAIIIIPLLCLTYLIGLFVTWIDEELTEEIMDLFGFN